VEVIGGGLRLIGGKEKGIKYIYIMMLDILLYTSEK